MNAWSAFFRRCRRVCGRMAQVPSAIMVTWEQKRLELVRRDLEAERLDRIRNPSKYRGK